jgi:hypothetical protein
LTKTPISRTALQEGWLLTVVELSMMMPSLELPMDRVWESTARLARAGALVGAGTSWSVR